MVDCNTTKTELNERETGSSVLASLQAADGASVGKTLETP